MDTPSTVPSTSVLHRHSTQTASVRLIVSSDGEARDYDAVVTRITPLDIRLALRNRIPATTTDLYRWNPLVEVFLDLPAVRRRTKSRGKIAGLAHNFEPGAPPVILDLEFPELTEEEEKVLKDSNPLLVLD